MRLSLLKITMKKIIGLVGKIASGKGTAAKYLTEKYNAKSYRFSTPLRDILKRLYLEINRENMQKISTILRKNLEENILAKVISEDVKEDANEMIVIDGIRRLADIEYLIKLPEFKLIYITADAKNRYERLITRGENEDDKNKTFEQFMRDHEAETELEIPLVASQADYRIDNNGDLNNLHKRLAKIINA